MKGKSLFRMLALGASIVVLVLALAPVSFAGEDGDDQPRTHHSSGGGGDTGSASGGAETGFGGMVANTNGSMTLPFALASGGLVVLTVAGGLASRRRVFE